MFILIFILIFKDIISFKPMFYVSNFKTHLLQTNMVYNTVPITDLIKPTKYYHFDKLPTLEPPNDTGHLTWYPIGFAKDFSSNQRQITIRDVNYIVWKHNNTYYGMRDACSHQGSSFLKGRTYANKITCPYHGYIFNGKNGNLIKIPKMVHFPCEHYNINVFKVVEKGEIVYLNTIPLNEENKQFIDENLIFVEPEFYNSDHKVILLDKTFEQYAKLVTVNSLDICHIGFVHTFGNKQKPNPLNLVNISKLSDTHNHYHALYKYIAGKQSLVRSMYNYSEINVENEYILPHTTVARVLFGNFSSTIITHALPVSVKPGLWKTKLFVKAYRNYMYYDLNKCNDLSYPFKYLINRLGDYITLDTMVSTLQQDKDIVDNIDKFDYESMHGKFSIYYDMLSDHYKQNYNSYYENGPKSF